jgi:hypothetical protein
MTSGSGISLRVSILDGVVCVWTENLDEKTVEGPESQGSSTMEKEPGALPGEGGKSKAGRKVSKKVASALRWVISNDILEEQLDRREVGDCQKLVEVALLKDCITLSRMKMINPSINQPSSSQKIDSPD